MPTNIIIFIVSFIVLSYASALLVHSFTRMAKLLGMSEYLIAFVLMSILTSIPELFISIFSIIQGIPKLSLGNVLGSNLLIVTLIIGAVAVISDGIKIESKISHQNFILIFFIAFLPMLLAVDGVLSRGDGVVLLSAFVLYMWRLIRDKEYFTKRVVSFDYNIGSILNVFKSFRGFFVGILLLIVSSFLIVFTSKAIVVYLGSTFVLFGLLFVAMGTALPELIFGIRAAAMNHSEMTLGNSLGSVAFNSTFIVGLLSVIKPVEVDMQGEMFLVSVFLFIAFVLFNFFSYSKLRVSRGEGVMLLLIYMFFLTIQIL